MSFDEELLNPVFDPKGATENIPSTSATRIDHANLKPLWSSTLEKAAQTLTLPQTRVEIRRKVAWQDFLALRKIQWFNIASSFDVKFVGELGVDGGGPKRELFSGKVNIDLISISWKTFMFEDD